MANHSQRLCGGILKEPREEDQEQHTGPGQVLLRLTSVSEYCVDCVLQRLSPFFSFVLHLLCNARCEASHDAIHF
jgi:hypothetical protein